MRVIIYNQISAKMPRSAHHKIETIYFICDDLDMQTDVVVKIVVILGAMEKTKGENIEMIDIQSDL